MWKVTRKGLRAHKLRFALTALAVLLGVAFMSGTFVLTDTVRKVFNDLFTELNENTDAYVRSADSTDLDFGGTIRPRIPETVVGPVRGVDGVELAEPDFTIEQGVRLLDQDGEPMGNPTMGAPTLGFNWEEVTGGTGITFVEGHAPETADEVVLDKNSADEGGYEVGDQVRVTSPFGDPTRSTPSQASSASASATAPGVRSPSSSRWRKSSASGAGSHPRRPSPRSAACSSVPRTACRSTSFAIGSRPRSTPIDSKASR